MAAKIEVHLHASCPFNVTTCPLCLILVGLFFFLTNLLTPSRLDCTCSSFNPHSHRGGKWPVLQKQQGGAQEGPGQFNEVLSPQRDGRHDSE